MSDLQLMSAVWTKLVLFSVMSAFRLSWIIISNLRYSVDCCICNNVFVIVLKFVHSNFNLMLLYTIHEEIRENFNLHTFLFF